LYAGDRKVAAEHQSDARTAGYPLVVLAATGVVLLVLNILANADRQVITILVRPLEQDLRLNDFQMSLLLGPAFSLLYAVTGLPFGWAADRLSRRWIILAGAAVWGAATALAGLAASFGQLLAARVGVGVGEASLTPSAWSTIVDVVPKSWLALAVSAYNTGVTIGGAVGLVLGGWLIDHVAAGPLAHLAGLAHLRPWQWVFLLLGAPAVLVAPFALLLPETRKDHPQTDAPPPTWGSVFQLMGQNKRAMAAAFLGGTGIVTITQAIGAWTPTFMHRAFHLSATTVGLYFGVLLFAVGTFGHFFVGATVDALYRRGIKDAYLRYPAAALLLSIPCAIAAFLSHQAWLFLALIGFFYLTTFPTMGVCLAATQLMTPPLMRGRIVAAFLLCIHVVGSSIGAPFVGLLVTYGLRDPSKLGAAVCGVLALTGPLTIALLWQGMKPLRAFEASAAVST